MIYLDIETLAQDPYPWMVRPSEVEAPANYRDPEKIAAYLESALAKYHDDLRARSSLEPLLGGVIVCVGCAVDDGPVVVLVNDTGDEEGERAMLRKLERAICRAERADHPIVSWNGPFDWGWLAKRAIRYGLSALAGRMLADKPWGDRMHVDARGPWVRMDSRSLSRQHDVARFLGIEVDDAITGADVAETWAEGPEGRAKVVEHCRSDVGILRQITQIEIEAGWLRSGPMDPSRVRSIPLEPRGSVADLVRRIDLAQIGKPHEEVVSALAEGRVQVLPGGLRATLDQLGTVSTEQLRAILVALGERP